MKNKNGKNILKGGLLAFLLLMNIAIAAAKEMEGVVVRKVYNGDELQIFVDTDPNTPGADNIIMIPRIDHPTYMPIDEFVNEGSKIKFDDEHGAPYGRYNRNPGFTIISIDGTNIIDLVGDVWGGIYTYAEAAGKRGR